MPYYWIDTLLASRSDGVLCGVEFASYTELLHFNGVIRYRSTGCFLGIIYYRLNLHDSSGFIIYNLILNRCINILSSFSSFWRHSAVQSSVRNIVAYSRLHISTDTKTRQNISSTLTDEEKDR